MGIKTPEDAEPNSWHRFFAIENNNRAWELASLPVRNNQDSLEMMNAAHASALHWSKVGTPLNDMRAKMLLAEVHALLMLDETALPLADEVRNYFLSRETDDWEIAFVHTIHAHAAFAAGKEELFRDSYRAAQHAIAVIADDADRDIVLQIFNQVPVPGQ